MAWPMSRLTRLQKWKHDRVLLVVIWECGQKPGRRNEALRYERTPCED